MRVIYLSCVSLFLCAFAWGQVEYDGTDDRIVVSDDNSLDFTGDFTLSAWIKRTATDAIGWDYIFDKEAGTGNGYQCGFYQNYLRVRIDAGTGVAGSGDTTVTDNNWHIVNVVADRDGNATFYIDGQPDGTLDISGESGDISSGQDLSIGSSELNTDSFAGMIAAIMFHNTVLTAEEIGNMSYVDTNGQAHSTGYLLSRTNIVLALDNPAGYATGDSLDGLTFPDRSGNGNNGTGDDGGNNSGLTAAGTIVRRRGPKYQ